MASIINLLSDLRRVREVDAINRQLAEVLTAVHKTGKKGSLVINLTFEPDAGGIVVARCVSTPKAPERIEGTLFFWQDARNEDSPEIGKNDPQQPSLPFHTVPAGADQERGAISG